MSKSNKNIEEIRKMLKDLKSKKYEIVNPDLVELDEYIKSLYIKVLCTVVQYENDPTDMQILFLKRIINGIGVEDSVEEYMRKALEISEQDIQEFLSIVGDSKIKYYFATDGLILLSIGSNNSKDYEYLAELIELLGIDKDDLKYLCTVAKSILQQESSFYDEAKEMINERVEKLNFTPYIQNYYAGAITDTDTEKHYYAPDKKLSEIMEYPTIFKGRKVVFENVALNIKEEWKFEGCEEVIFKNCLILGDKHSFTFSSIGKLVFDNCKVKDFSNRIAYTQSINKLEIVNSEFIECGYTGSGDNRGGMFWASGSEFKEIKVVNNELINCYIKASTYRYNYGVTAILIGFEGSSEIIQSFIVVNNKFTGCECKNNGNYTEAIIGHCYPSKYENNDNKFSGEVTRLFENL